MLRRLLLLLPLVALSAACDDSGPPAPPRPLPPIEVYFSPGGGATEAVVREIDAARQTIFVQAYSFTSRPIAAALVQAQRRGVAVRAILDKSVREEKYSEADFLARAGIAVLVDAAHAIAHNKVMVLDGEVVITGSFNFTRQAEHENAENLLVIRDRELAERYLANWHAHAAHSQRYAGHSP
jgi:phosphatidylserine/phosphatidylglycerophosphate/cardiolipin synthase-like enzyme